MPTPATASAIPGTSWQPLFPPPGRWPAGMCTYRPEDSKALAGLGRLKQWEFYEVYTTVCAVSVVYSVAPPPFAAVKSSQTNGSVIVLKSSSPSDAPSPSESPLNG